MPLFTVLAMYDGFLNDDDIADFLRVGFINLEMFRATVTVYFISCQLHASRERAVLSSLQLILEAIIFMTPVVECKTFISF